MFLSRSLLKTVLKRATLPAKTITRNQASLCIAIKEENFDLYSAGGYHPVRIGDLFKDGAYKVINKLGYGQYSTVWLAYDTRSVLTRKRPRPPISHNKQKQPPCRTESVDGKCI